MAELLFCGKLCKAFRRRGILRGNEGAGFLGFTGTPLIDKEEERTREVIGDYVSVYDFARSVEDGATVPLFYDNRIPELQLTNDNFGEDLQRLVEEAELDSDGVHQTIRVVYRSLPAPYSADLKRVKTNLTYAHVFDSYSGSGKSIYEVAGD